MANYLPSYNITLNHRSESNSGEQPAGASLPVQHAQGVMDDTPEHPCITQIPVACEAGESTGPGPSACCTPGHFNTTHTHTCAICAQTYPNNYALERHAAKEHHQAFLCTCGTNFGRLGSLKRHITAQDGPKYYCDYCDGNKSFAREDKFIDHLRASHKFGDKAIAQFRTQARAQSKGNGNTSTVSATGTGQPVSTSAGNDAGSGVASMGQMAYSADTSAGSSGGVDGVMNDFPMFSAAGLQPFAPVEDYSWIDAAGDFAGFDFSGLDFSGVDFAEFDGDMDLSIMDNHL